MGANSLPGVLTGLIPGYSGSPRATGPGFTEMADGSDPADAELLEEDAVFGYTIEQYRER